MRFDLVIFDCDGVLVDSEAVANEVLAATVRGHGVALTGAESQSIFMGMSLDAVRLHANERFGIAMPEDWAVAYYATLIPMLAERCEPIEGVHDVVGRLKQANVPFCVASQGPPEKMRATLTASGLWADFGGSAFSAKMIRHPKPAPDLFLHAAQTKGFPPERCAVVEDTVVGVTAGIAAGMTVFAYCSPESAAAMTGLGATPFHTMRDLPGLFGLD
ncbi:MAG TPA: HAD-IA family hydrolase [Alphaproteobacteria bacterium]|nr:HAD-IA family hydrolase [Alphaproteobacteria bacterium]